MHCDLISLQNRSLLTGPLGPFFLSKYFSKKLPTDIPARPDLIIEYRSEWISWKDWLGTNKWNLNKWFMNHKLCSPSVAHTNIL